MKKKYFFLYIGIMSVTQYAFSEPEYFYYKTYGIADYHNGWRDLNVEKHDDSLSAAVSAVESYISSDDIYTEPFDDTFSPSELTTSWELPYWDFSVIHMHGWYTGLSFPGRMPDFVPHEDLHFGGDYSEYTKWLWASSCSWFQVPYFAPPYVALGDREAFTYWTGGGYRWWDDEPKWCSLDINSTGGVWVGNYGGVHYISELDNDDWFKFKVRLTNTEPGVDQNYRLNFFNHFSVKMIAAHTGQIDVYLGSESDTDLGQEVTAGRTHLGTININATGEIERGIELAISEDSRVNDRCIYLVFNNIAGGKDLGMIKYVYLHVDESQNTHCHMVRDGIADSAFVRERDWGKSFKGLHAIMGWGSTSRGDRDPTCFRPFFRRWIEYGGYLGYSYLYAVQDRFGAPHAGYIPAIAYDYGQIYSDEWHDDFFWEEWEYTPGNQNTAGQCEIWYSLPEDVVWD